MLVTAAPRKDVASVARRASSPAPRPKTLEERYQPLEFPELGDEIFLRLKLNVYAALDRVRAGGVFREAGKLGAGRPYFYVKPAGRPGLLFERSGGGWVVAEAEKIASSDLFVRRGSAVDAVSLYLASDRPVLPRVRSPWLGGDLWPLAVYEQKLLERLGLKEGK